AAARTAQHEVERGEEQRGADRVGAKGGAVLDHVREGQIDEHGKERRHPAEVEAPDRIGQHAGGERERIHDAAGRDDLRHLVTGYERQPGEEVHVEILQRSRQLAASIIVDLRQEKKLVPVYVETEEQLILEEKFQADQQRERGFHPDDRARL